MRIHPRTRKVQAAERQLGDEIAGIVNAFELMHIELQQILASQQLSWLKYALREERHPGNPDKKADEA